MLGGVQPKRGCTGWGRDRCGALRGKNVSVGIKQNRTKPGIGTMGGALTLFCVGLDCCFACATPGADSVLLGSWVAGTRRSRSASFSSKEHVLLMPNAWRGAAGRLRLAADEFALDKTASADMCSHEQFPTPSLGPTPKQTEPDCRRASSKTQTLKQPLYASHRDRI
jgi:hypothetical protein